MNLPPYALVSPVRNEAKYIRYTLDSVIAQTHLPVRWVIVSDGSTDETDEIVRQYAAKHPLIHLVRREPDPTRNFGSKVRAIREGISHLDGVDYAFIGNLDGDVSLPTNYFERLFGRFEADPKLGVAGGHLYDDYGGRLRKQVLSVESSVSGPVQMFRRVCYESFGGYTPLPYGGVDAVAESMARMRGWRVRTFEDLPVTHHRPTGSQGKSVFRARYDLGRHEFVIGYHPLFGLARAANKIREYPYVVGALCYFAGFFDSYRRRLPLAVPDEFTSFLRREQLGRLLRRNRV